MKLIENENEEIKLYPLWGRVVVWVIFSPFLLLGYFFSLGYEPRRLHRVVIFCVFLWFCYLFIDHGHDLLNQIYCRFGFSGCNSYQSPTAAETAWRKMWLTPLLVGAAISSIWQFINRVKAELKFRRNPIDQYLEMPPKRGFSGWCYRWLWWL